MKLREKWFLMLGMGFVFSFIVGGLIVIDYCSEISFVFLFYSITLLLTGMSLGSLAWYEGDD